MVVGELLGEPRTGAMPPPEARLRSRVGESGSRGVGESERLPDT
jgi:hypothetical protein